MIYIAADHNGYFLKEKLKEYLSGRKQAFRDLGPKKSDKGDDYPDFAVKVARALKKEDLGILLCGSGHGMVIAANKIAGIRAILANNPRSAERGRHDDHANVIALAAWETDLKKAKAIVKAFLAAQPGKAARYLRRVKKIQALKK